MRTIAFLTPLAEVVTIPITSTVRDALDRMEQSGYTAVPLLSPDGWYVGVLSEGDILHYLKHHPEVRLENADRVPVSAVTRRRVIRSMLVDAPLGELLALALKQNLVPVVDDRGMLLGIVRRSVMMSFAQDLVRAMVGVPTVGSNGAANASTFRAQPIPEPRCDR